MNKFAMFFGYCNRAELSEEERMGAIVSITNGRTASLKEVSQKELNDVTAWAAEREAAKNTGMRGKIIFHLCNIGYKTEAGHPDWDRINAYVKSHGGDANPKKKALYKLKHSELKKVVLVVQQYHSTFMKRLKPEPA
jgi:hypothetical protein